MELQGQQTQEMENSVSSNNMAAPSVANIRLTTGSKAPMVACGDNHTVLLKADGSVWTWGKYEIDFFAKSVHTDQHTYAIEVKTEKTAERPQKKSWKREKRIMFCMQREIHMAESMEIFTRSRSMG